MIVTNKFAISFSIDISYTFNTAINWLNWIGTKRNEYISVRLMYKSCVLHDHSHASFSFFLFLFFFFFYSTYNFRWKNILSKKYEKVIGYGNNVTFRFYSVLSAMMDWSIWFVTTAIVTCSISYPVCHKDWQGRAVW